MPLDRQPPPIADSITSHVGLTPMIRLSPHNQGMHFKYVSCWALAINRPSLVQLLAKLELANPTGSHKDRVAHKIVQGICG